MKRKAVADSRTPMRFGALTENLLDGSRKARVGWVTVKIRVQLYGIELSWN